MTSTSRRPSRTRAAIRHARGPGRDAPAVAPQAAPGKAKNGIEEFRYGMDAKAA
jgi:hypothetical protein